MISLAKGRYRARLAESPADILRAQRLRARAFGLDRDTDFDTHDESCTHVLVEHRDSGELVCCFRLLSLTGQTISASYSAQHYELSALQNFEGRMAELGRFCICPEYRDPDILRVAWGALTQFVDVQGIALLFGCSSFPGTDSARYLDAFAMLRERHLAPKRWLPQVKAPDVVRFAARLRRTADRRKAFAGIPPLLRTYLAMGGWVSDHAVVDRDMNTLHVFTGVEIGAIPPARQRLLRNVAG